MSFSIGSALKVGLTLEGLVQVVDVRRVVLAVVNLHRLGVDGGFQRVEGVR